MEFLDTGYRAQEHNSEPAPNQNIDLTSTLYIDLTSTLHRPHMDPTSTLHHTHMSPRKINNNDINDALRYPMTS